MGTRPLDQTQNDTDLKFAEHTPLDYNLLSKKVFFLFFFEKVTLGAASLKKLLCHVDLMHISSIAFFVSIGH